jgi:hypothetical protein
MLRRSQNKQPLFPSGQSSPRAWSRRRILAAALRTAGALVTAVGWAGRGGRSAAAQVPLTGCPRGEDCTVPAFATSVWNEPWLISDVLTFQPGAILQFSRDAVIAGNGTIVVMARTLQSNEAVEGTITWDNSALSPPLQPPQAAAGTIGTNGIGTTGAVGTTGTDGADGITGPNLELWVLDAPENVRLTIKLPGQDGQSGGPGGAGGNGGRGASGRGGGYDDESPECDTPPCEQHTCWHPTPGQQGGNGGNGGNGGQGGNGGNGGQLTIFATQEHLATLSANIALESKGGQPAPAGGAVGQGGGPGPGGPGGAVHPAQEEDWLRNCGQQLKAEDGPPGGPGEPGANPGQPGELPGNQGQLLDRFTIVEATFLDKIATAPDP